MGVMRFVVPDALRISDSALQTAYVASLEGVPWRTIVERTPEGFQVRRRVDESGNFYISWRLEDGGQLLLSTATLMVRERPYLLPLELARGTLNRLRNQAAAWELAGLTITTSLKQLIDAATKPFAKAATLQHDLKTCCRLADETIRASLAGTTALVDEYNRQVLAMRHQQHPKLPMLLGMRLDDTNLPIGADKRLAAAANVVAVSTRWEKIEPVAGEFDWGAADKLIDWPRQQGLKTIAGPLLSFDPDWLPDWLVLWEDDFQALQSYVATFVGEAVQRWRGRVNLWHCAARLNSGKALALTDEQRLKLAVVALETVRKYDPKTPSIISFDQPWAEYMANSNSDVAPLHFADALARANLGLSGLGLEIDCGFTPNGSLPRDPTELSRLLDQWSLLGLPLVVMLTLPSSADGDAGNGNGNGRTRAIAATHSRKWTAQEQSDLAEQIISTCLCKQSVQAVLWNQTLDTHPRGLPHAGLFDAAGKPKPLLQTLADIRKRHIG
jgi:GH35 family endo-1,4-beta-xylanase